MMSNIFWMVGERDLTILAKRHINFLFKSKFIARCLGSEQIRYIRETGSLSVSLSRIAFVSSSMELFWHLKEVVSQGIYFWLECTTPKTTRSLTAGSSRLALARRRRSLIEEDARFSTAAFRKLRPFAFWSKGFRHFARVFSRCIVHLGPRHANMRARWTVFRKRSVLADK